MGFQHDKSKINRNGRPKKGLCAVDILDKIVGRKESLIDGKKSDGYESLWNTLYEMAVVEKNIVAIKIIFEYKYGKPMQPTDSNITIRSNMKSFFDYSPVDNGENQYNDSDKKATGNN